MNISRKKGRAAVIVLLLSLLVLLLVGAPSQRAQQRQTAEAPSHSGPTRLATAELQFRHYTATDVPQSLIIGLSETVEEVSAVEVKIGKDWRDVDMPIEHRDNRLAVKGLLSRLVFELGNGRHSFGLRVKSSSGDFLGEVELAVDLERPEVLSAERDKQRSEIRLKVREQVSRIAGIELIDASVPKSDRGVLAPQRPSSENVSIPFEYSATVDGANVEIVGSVEEKYLDRWLKLYIYDEAGNAKLVSLGEPAKEPVSAFAIDSSASDSKVRFWTADQEDQFQESYEKRCSLPIRLVILDGIMPSDSEKFQGTTFELDANTGLSAKSAWVEEQAKASLQDLVDGLINNVEKYGEKSELTVDYEIQSDLIVHHLKITPQELSDISFFENGKPILRSHNDLKGEADKELEYSSSLIGLNKNNKHGFRNWLDYINVAPLEGDELVFVVADFFFTESLETGALEIFDDHLGVFSNWILSHHYSGEEVRHSIAAMRHQQNSPAWPTLSENLEMNDLSLKATFAHETAHSLGLHHTEEDCLMNAYETNSEDLLECLHTEKSSQPSTSYRALVAHTLNCSGISPDFIGNVKTSSELTSPFCQWSAGGSGSAILLHHVSSKSDSEWCTSRFVGHNSPYDIDKGFLSYQDFVWPVFSLPYSKIEELKTYSSGIALEDWERFDVYKGHPPIVQPVPEGLQELFEEELFTFDNPRELYELVSEFSFTPMGNAPENFSCVPPPDEKNECFRPSVLSGNRHEPWWSYIDKNYVQDMLMDGKNGLTCFPPPSKKVLGEAIEGDIEECWQPPAPPNCQDIPHGQEQKYLTLKGCEKTVGTFEGESLHMPPWFVCTYESHVMESCYDPCKDPSKNPLHYDCGAAGADEDIAPGDKSHPPAGFNPPPAPSGSPPKELPCADSEAPQCGGNCFDPGAICVQKTGATACSCVEEEKYCSGNKGGVVDPLCTGREIGDLCLGTPVSTATGVQLVRSYCDSNCLCPVPQSAEVVSQ